MLNQYGGKVRPTFFFTRGIDNKGRGWYLHDTGSKDPILLLLYPQLHPQGPNHSALVIFGGFEHEIFHLQNFNFTTCFAPHRRKSEAYLSFPPFMIYFPHSISPSLILISCPLTWFYTLQFFMNYILCANIYVHRLQERKNNTKLGLLELTLVGHQMKTCHQKIYPFYIIMCIFLAIQGCIFLLVEIKTGLSSQIEFSNEYYWKF